MLQSLRNYILGFTIILILVIFSGCAKPSDQQPDSTLPITSFRDIPGITAEEITRIESLIASGREFTYGMLDSTEAFVMPNDERDGFAVLLSELLSELFEIPFHLNIFGWSELILGLEALEIDFTSETTPTEVRQASRDTYFGQDEDGADIFGRGYFMSLPVAVRMLRIFTLMDSPIRNERDVEGLRIGFLEGTTTAGDIFQLYRIPFEAVEIIVPEDAPEDVDDYVIAALMLKSGEIDAFVEEAPADPVFNDYSDYIRSSVFFPMVFSPVSLTTVDPELAVIISVLNKYIEAGGRNKLHELYTEGDFRYSRDKLYKSFTPEEKDFIRDNPISLVAFEHDNYPINFYNEASGQFEGIAIDVLAEISRLTDLVFEPAFEPDTPWEKIFNSLISGEITMAAQLLQSEERIQSGAFIWSSIPYSHTLIALISKSEYPDLAPFQVANSTVGVVGQSGFEDIFIDLFSFDSNLIRYDFLTNTLIALEREEVDLVMGSAHVLLKQTNFREKTGYKINLRLDVPLNSYFGFHKDETVLRSIIDKAQQFVKTETIELSWTGRSFDYSIRLAQERARFMAIFVSIAVVVILVLFIFVIFIAKNRRVISKQSVNLKEALEDAKAASLAKSSFLATMSHEIRTPMNAILGITESQLQNETLEPKYADALNKIYNSGDLLLSIINDILDMSKIDANKFELIPVEYKIPSMIHDVVNINLVRFGSNPLEFSLEVDDNIPLTVFGDDLRVKQILNNLLSNAFKYTKKGGVTLGVSVEPGDVDNEVILMFHVCDTGLGMTKEQVDSLFDEYSRFDMKANRTTEGTGLGMNIARNLVRLMKGKIHVDSELGKGTTVTLCVPQGDVGAEPIGKEISERLARFRENKLTQARRAQIIREPMPYGKVLVVDDSEMNLYVAKGLLHPYELFVDTADSGFVAIEKIKNGNVYDIVFMDYMMPLMDGIETTGIIRELGYSKPVIALTADAVIGRADMFLSEGFDDFISKPIDIRQMDSLLKRWIRDKHPPEVVEAALQAHRQKESESPAVSADSPAGGEISRAAGQMLNIKIADIDIKKGLEKYGGDDKTYLKILQSYVTGTRSLFGILETAGKDNQLADYKRAVHSIKGMSYEIYADQLGKSAAALEEAAKNGDTNYIDEHNPTLVEKLNNFIGELENMLRAMIAKKDKPDIEVLSKLRTACENYSMDGVNEAMAELGGYEYESDDGLAAWLHEMVSEMNFTKIVEKLSDLGIS